MSTSWHHTFAHARQRRPDAPIFGALTTALLTTALLLASATACAQAADAERKATSRASAASTERALPKTGMAQARPGGQRDRRQQADMASDVVGQFLKALADADPDAVYQFSTGAYWREFDRKKQESSGLSGYLRRSPQRPLEHLVSCSACLKQECWTLTSVKIQGPPQTRDTVLFVTRRTAEGTRVYGSYQWNKESQARFDSMEGGICR